MGEIPLVRGKRAGYENFVAECPSCGEESIFNRASDLRSFEPIAGRDVACLNVACGRPFRIVGDLINSPHEMIVYDCYELIERKHYMNCILSLTTAYEVFFRLFFRVELLYKPFASERNYDFEELNRLEKELEKNIERLTFFPMRAQFLRHIVSGRRPKNLAESAAMIAELPGRANDVDLEYLPDTQLNRILMALKDTGIANLRNRIVHKRAYRPTGDEARSALKETMEILFSLQGLLQLDDDLNRYMTTH